MPIYPPIHLNKEQIIKPIPKIPYITPFSGGYGYISELKHGQVIPIGSSPSVYYDFFYVDLEGNYDPSLSEHLIGMESIRDNLPDILPLPFNGLLDLDVYRITSSFNEYCIRNLHKGPKSVEERSAQYVGQVPFLGEVLDSGHAFCSEFAALAQIWLQRNKVKSNLILGSLLERCSSFSKPSKHSFVHIPDHGLIFEPMGRKGIPTLYNSEDFNKLYGLTSQSFARARMVDSPWSYKYYGFGSEDKYKKGQLIKD